MAARVNRRGGSGRAPASGARPAPDPLAGVLIAAAALTALVHLLAPAIPEGWAWGVRWIQWLSVTTGALLLLAASLLMLPALGSRLAAPARGLGDGVARAPAAAALALGLALAALAWTLPDETQMTGDFLLRLGLVRERERAEAYTPQALPLDVLVHTHVARALAAPLGGEQAAGRALGAAWAFAMGAAGIALARALAVRGAAALVTAVAAATGGALALHTGYPKAFGPLAVLGVFAVAGAWHGARGGSPLPLAIAVALALLWHRSALVLAPLWAVGTWIAMRAGDRGAGAATLAAWLLPPAAFAITAPHTLATFGRYDAARHVARAPFELVAMADRLQVILFAAPLALVGVAAVARLRPALRSARVHVALAALLPALAMLFAVQPQQGVPRDWDVYAVAGGIVAALVAAAIGRALAAAPGGPAAAPALVGLAVVFAFQPLAALHHNAAGEARARAIAQGPPLRSEGERAALWDYLGIRAANAQDMRAAADAWGEAAQLAPSPRMLRQWGWAELGVPRFDRARRASEMLIARDSTSRPGWIGLGTAALGLRDTALARRAVERAIALAPGDPGNAVLRDTYERGRQAVAAGSGAR